MQFNLRDNSLLSLLMFLVIPQVFSAEEPRKPNIVILLADDLGYGDIGPFGNTSLPTPNLDSMAKDGFVLSHHLTAASLCTPSRAALLTGRYPIRYGMTSNWITRVFMFVASSGGLPNSETTFAKMLKQVGYRTGLIGKWHLGSQCANTEHCSLPMGHGFDYFYGLPLTNLKDFGKDGSSVILSFFPPFRLVLLTTGIACILSIFILKHYQNMFNANANIQRMNEYELTNMAPNELEIPDEYESDYSNKETVTRPHLMRKAIRTTCCTPCAQMLLITFFSLILCISIFGILFQLSMTRLNSILMQQTEVIEQPIQMQSLTQRLIDQAKQFIQANQTEPFMLLLAFYKVHTAHFPSIQFAGKSLHGEYGDSVMELDWAVGEILKQLDDLQMRENTFVYFSSDNGAHLEELDNKGRMQGGYNGRLSGGKGQGAMEGGIRVPALIRYPRVAPSNRSSPILVNTPCSQLDLFTTLLELVAGENHFKSDGRSLLPLLKMHFENANNDKVNNLQETVEERFLFHYCGSHLHGVRYSMNSSHVYKLYYHKPLFRSDSDLRCAFVCRCEGKQVQTFDPPQLFNIVDDLEEKKPINTFSPSEHVLEVLQRIEQAVSEHRQSLLNEGQASSQLTLWQTIWKPHLQPCCNFPLCSCTEKVK